ncbi:aKG-HExxH-type peptide beta-hydroxylase [Staphylococcus chromogenes]|uniref:aKG-HExxH-type peptide beta-hydroxylase n=1 Tax=Staphylococcus chromogenes TaxID=46126 RepID=UPI002884DB83|nr:HEXXH motif-containing putative peptide modification protein [Staphylococcus chromogenes]MDT0656344.1 HEXXH motif-containing putative peptide modification protein [Staphylococcus chromogenes]MDT0672752.1 HEXXH motif-containing putative peptide modification protein [Staphylococcus chromogenes]MDT0674932.1 HEXXH motif-containing putative peptide modification protein [Staphylococcus chromogenes]MDT0699122.1 HEXXH motif-containing putative peptide modification protein [Staphylococcus chromogenes
MTKDFNLPYLNNSHIKKNIKDLYNFTKEEYGTSLEENTSLKEKYFESINKLQSVQVPFSTEGIIVSFEDKYLQKSLLDLEMIDPEDLVNNEHIFSSEEQKETNKRIEKALRLIKFLHRDLYELIETIVGSFLILKKENFGGGSVSNILGMIWLNPQNDWNVIDCAEAIYHEFIHQSIFLDDMVNSIFPNSNACAQDDALVTSTILKRKRPLDKSFHAAGVSLGIMHLYYLLHDKEKSYQHYDDFKQTIKELNDKTQFLDDYGIYTLQEFNKYILNPDYNVITEILKNNDKAV